MIYLYLRYLKSTLKTESATYSYIRLLRSSDSSS